MPLVNFKNCLKKFFRVIKSFISIISSLLLLLLQKIAIIEVTILYLTFQDCLGLPTSFLIWFLYCFFSHVHQYIKYIYFAKFTYHFLNLNQKMAFVFTIPFIILTIFRDAFLYFYFERLYQYVVTFLFIVYNTIRMDIERIDSI